MNSRLLAAALAILVFRTTGTASVGAPTGKVPLRLGGLSDVSVLELLLPGYEAPPERSTNPEAEPEWNVTRAIVGEWLVTDFGFRKGKYLLAIVNGTTGACAQCGFTVVGLLDPRENRVIWRLEPKGYFGHKLETLRLRASDPRLSFSFRYDAGAHEHNSYVQQAIYRPRALKGGGIECDLVWSDHISSGAGLGANGVMWHSRCASMTPGARAKEWIYRRRSFFGMPEGNEEYDVEEGPGFANIPCNDDSGGVIEIRRNERWIVQRGSGLMSRVSIRSERIDHAPSSTFPFSLPARSEVWAQAKRQSTNVTAFGTSVHSLNGRFKASQSKRTSMEKEVTLTTGDGQVLRSLKGWHADFFVGDVETLGWADDESRFFAVVVFEGERALLSFSVKGTDDYWEELLDPHDTSWRDGFVMRATRPARSN